MNEIKQFLSVSIKMNKLGSVCRLLTPAAHSMCYRRVGGCFPVPAYCLILDGMCGTLSGISEHFTGGRRKGAIFIYGREGGWVFFCCVFHPFFSNSPSFPTINLLRK